MVKVHSKIESKPGVVFLSQIVSDSKENDNSKTTKKQKQVANTLAEWGFNFALPLLCLTDEEDKYQLLTGAEIYKLAVESGIEKIWAVLIAAKKPEAEKAIEPALLQYKFNDRVIDSQDIAEFVEFLNKSDKSALTSVPGIKDGYAKMIADKRPYTSEDVLGSKRTLNWLKAYKQSQIKP